MSAHLTSDDSIQHDVLDELKWDPRIDPEEVGVSVHDAIVTLSGFVASYAKKMAAAEAAHRVRGVTAVANDLEVRVPGFAERTDEDLARSVLQALEWGAHIPTEALEVTVADGWVTLNGDVQTLHEKDAAEEVVRYLTGLRGITNALRVHPRIKPADIRRQIEQALVRSAEIDARRVSVEVEASRAVLKGSVRSMAEKRDAERAARSAPGITEIDNRIVVMP